MTIKRLSIMVLVLLLAIGAGTGNLIAVIEFYVGEIARLAGL